MPGSSNGTFLNSPDQRVTQAIDADRGGYGLLRLARGPGGAAPAGAAAHARGPKPPPLPPPIPDDRRFQPRPRCQPSPEPATVTPWTILVLAQAPVIAILILLAFGRQASAPSRRRAGPRSPRASPRRCSPWRWRRSGWADRSPHGSSLAGRSVSGPGRFDRGQDPRLAAARFAVLGVLLRDPVRRAAGDRLLGERPEGTVAVDVRRAVAGRGRRPVARPGLIALIRSPGIAVAVLMVCLRGDDRRWAEGSGDCPHRARGPDRGGDALALGVRGAPAAGERASMRRRMTPASTHPIAPTTSPRTSSRPDRRGWARRPTRWPWASC